MFARFLKKNSFRIFRKKKKKKPLEFFPGEIETMNCVEESLDGTIAFLDYVFKEGIKYDKELRDGR